MPIEVHNVAGKLVEVRALPPITKDELIAFGAEAKRLIAVCGEPIVTAADFRAVKIFHPEVANFMRAMFKHHNPNVAGAAFVISPNVGVLATQMERIIAEGGNPNRVCFRDVNAALEWLDGKLKPKERLRLRKFLEVG